VRVQVSGALGVSSVTNLGERNAGEHGQLLRLADERRPRVEAGAVGSRPGDDSPLGADVGEGRPLLVLSRAHAADRAPVRGAPTARAVPASSTTEAQQRKHRRTACRRTSCGISILLGSTKTCRGLHVFWRVPIRETTDPELVLPHSSADGSTPQMPWARMRVRCERRLRRPKGFYGDQGLERERAGSQP
jgi:hypothetical protein